MEHEVQIHYELESLKFGQLRGSANGVAIVTGCASYSGQEARFRFLISPRNDGEWSLKEFKWEREVSSTLASVQVLQALVNKAAKLLYPINMWPEQQEAGGARLVMNQKIPPASAVGKVMISFRPDLLSMPSPPWEAMWDLILARVEADRYFQVCGFDEADVHSAIHHLQRVFPASWVRAKYKAAVGTHRRTFGMGTEFPPDHEFWFPAYHLARTALGAICIDPGWNYLIEIGLSLSELTGFNGLQKLEQQLCRSSGVRHQLCLAADLFKRGFLTGLEPETGSGHARSDLLAKCEGREYEIEVKELTSEEPGRGIQREVQRKVERLPRRPIRRVVFHVVLAERGIFEKRKEQRFFDEVEHLGQKLPSAISAIVAGRCFVDSAGGRREEGCRTVHSESTGNSAKQS
jgi:hypothetical protein